MKALLAQRVFDGKHVLPPQAVLIEDATVIGLVAPDAMPRGIEVMQLNDAALLAPGFVDLQVNGQSATALLERAKGVRDGQTAAGGQRAAIIAFGPHVAVDRLAEAATAGADLVVSRGELLGALPAVVERVRAAVQKGSADGSG